MLLQNRKKSGASASGAPVAEKIAQQARRLALCNIAIDFWSVVACGLREETHPIFHATPLFIAGRKIKPFKARQRDCRGAHGTRLQGHIETAPQKPLMTTGCCRRPDNQQFRMRGRIMQLPHAIAITRQHLAAAIHQHGPHRHLTAGPCRFCLAQGKNHKAGFLFPNVAQDTILNQKSKAMAISSRTKRRKPLRAGSPPPPPGKTVRKVSPKERAALPKGGKQAPQQGATAEISHAAPAAPSEPVITAPMRIAKAIARAGLGSRREAERQIAAGRVTVNGNRLVTPAFTVSPGDLVEVDGHPLPQTLAIRLWRYHKPRGRLTTRHDPQGRPTIYQDLPAALAGVLAVGRLDFNSEGLLLLTTHGGLARHMELPASGFVRRYRVRARGQASQAQLDTLQQGITIEGVHYAPMTARLERQQGHNAWLDITLREGKNREIRRVLAVLGLEVNRLIRVQYGPFELGQLGAGELAELAPTALDSLAASLPNDLKHALAARPQSTSPKRSRKVPRRSPSRPRTTRQRRRKR